MNTTTITDLQESVNFHKELGNIALKTDHKGFVILTFNLGDIVNPEWWVNIYDAKGSLAKVSPSSFLAKYKAVEFGQDYVDAIA